MPHSRRDMQRAAVLVGRFKVRNMNLLRTTCSEPDYLTKDQWTPDSWLYHSWEQRWRLSQASPTAEDDCRTPGNAADDLEQPTLETYRQNCKEDSKVTKGLF